MESHSFNVEHAIFFTQEGATLLQHHYYWHKKNKANGRNFIDGHYWTYNSALAYCDIFPYLSEKQIRSLHKNFVDAGLMIVGNYNKIAFDRTQWFALTHLGVACFENWNAQAFFPILQKVNWIFQNVKSKSQKVKSNLQKGAAIPDVNTYINTDINPIGFSGDFQSPLPPNEKDEFSLFLKAQGLHRLAATSFFLEKEKSCAKKEKYGEEGYLAALSRIDEYLAEHPKYIQGKKDFARVLDQFAEDKDIQACKAAFSAFFSAKYGEAYTTYTKSDLSALEAILAHLRKTAGDAMPTSELMSRFFAAMGALPKFDDPLKCKLVFITNELQQLIVAIKEAANGRKQAAGSVETFKERDARLERERKAAQEKELHDRLLYNNQVATITRLFNNGKPIPKELQDTQAYLDLTDTKKGW